tara:strand:- start:219 stop:509 length:291 start_codon:yes stop_codon:yes gene_type:complete
MYKSEFVVNNLLLELDSLTTRVKNIKQSYLNTAHNGLRIRLIYENQTLLERLKEISSIAKLLEIKNKEKISLSSLLVEKCRRTLIEMKIKRNLFFL